MPPQPPPGQVALAKARALEAIGASLADFDALRLKHFIMAALPRRLRLAPDKIALVISSGGQAIGIAAIRHNGTVAAAAGLKDDALANPGLWLEARAVEIETA